MAVLLNKKEVVKLDRILFGIGFVFLILAIASFVIVRKEMDAYGIPMGTFSPWAPLLFIAIIVGTVFTTWPTGERRRAQVKYIDEVRGFTGF